MIEGWAMLEHRRSPAAKVCEGTIPVLSGGPPVGRTRIASGAPNGRALPGVAGLTSRPKIAAPPWTARDRRGKPVAVPSLLLQAARFFRAHPAIGYVAAVALIGFATALQWVARDLYQGAPFLTIYPAIVLTAFIGGYRAGLLSALLAGLSQWYLFIPEYNLFAVVSYALDAILCVGLIEYINRSLEKETLAKEHQRLLKDELHHRMQNLFAVIQSVIRFSLPDGNVPVFASVVEDRLFGRLQAMFDANHFVGDATGNVALLDLVRGQIRGLGNRIVIRGRPYLLLDPQMTQNFSLILHELVTNSLKYGALSAADGHVLIELKETCSGVAFDWTEANGPAVKAPAKDSAGGGFGSHILGPFARGFCADVKISYEPSGLRYGLRIPRDQQA
jgi:two-component sensor histidine kinase